MYKENFSKKYYNKSYFLKIFTETLDNSFGNIHQNYLFPNYN